MKLNDKVYDILKWLSLIALDAFGIAYKGLAECWGWGFGDEVQTTCTIVSVLIGTLIGVSSVTYHKQEAVAAKAAVNEEIAELRNEMNKLQEAELDVDDTGNIDGGEV